MVLPRLAWLFACLALWLAAGGARAEVAVPRLQARVTDLTATLSAGDKANLEDTLKGLEARSGAQVAVLLVPTTQPETIAEYSIRVAEAWKLGRKGKDDGVLLLVAKNDRKVRIEVGYGLEGTLPDVVVHRIIDADITPRFKQGDFAGGIAAGVARIAALIEGQAAEMPPADIPAGSFDDIPVWLIVVALIVGSVLRMFLGPFFGGLTMGGLVGAGAWFVSGAIEVALFAALFAFVFFLVGLANWISIGLSGSSGGGGSSSGGGFSGGGGSFGGGGASGSW